MHALLTHKDHTHNSLMFYYSGTHVATLDLYM